ncbi:hypothetical protein GALMADRAFT_1135259 [Galerina marginata CBS 339.88]|uniref:Uncharacterized protein n=1 Tax=Galerina marginata (strain CBS 339.88) TaxID=685588 RepID=A0A067S7S1_GALM3|nr:hypothetical protein GALMADRAFT_1135259 [Galerina marginata CBS 339.88]
MNQEILLHSTANQLSAPSRANPVAIVGPGRILDEAFLLAGKSLGNAVNHLAHRLGSGPIATTKRIQTALGSQPNKILDALDRLNHYLNGSSGVDTQNVHILTTGFEKLMEYALPKETFSSQLQALNSIVMLATRYPGLRRLFAQSCHTPLTQKSLFASWRRIGESCDSNPQFVFYQKFAAFCLIDNHLVREVEDTLPSQLGGVGAINNAIETLLARIDGSDLESRAALRYLGGILELPVYWIDRSSPHTRVASKAIFERARDILLDLDLGTAIENDSAPPVVMESEAIDIFAHAILGGLEIWVGSHPVGPDSDNPSWESACWFSAGETFIKLLRMPRARKLLPLSSQRTQTDEVRKIYPVAENTTEVLVFRAMVDKSTEGSSKLNAPYETITKLSQLRADDIVIA